MGELKENVSMAELSIQHKQTFTFSSSMGEIVLRRIPFFENQRVVAEICEIDHEYLNQLEKLIKFTEIEEAQHKLIAAWEKQGEIGPRPVTFPPELVPGRQLAEIMVGEYNYRFYGPCFIYPKIETNDDLNTLFDNLEHSEREALVNMLGTLTSGLKDPEKNMMMLRIGKAYGIPWAPDMFLTNMTLQQAQLVLNQEKEETEAAQEEIRRLGLGKK
jgi:hypothetical protein